MNAQHTELQVAIRECADALAATAVGVGETQLENPTPCAEYTVGQLVDHLGGALQASARAARKEAQPGDASTAPAVSPKGLADAADQAAAAWARPAAYDGTTEFGPGEMPALFAASITLQELALHGWDLAQATGQSFVIDEATGRVVLGVVGQLAEAARSRGGYAEPVPVPADAPPFERALATSGRNPEWSP
ncbi:TIGR03086 family metal-binding protein [Streptomyces sp. NPDC046805]|uniref:TIGR03086 family metal-binding protein n=1 Tax=Streptomyces sp. NPDC046805 TaxID=3155134 RepID=UPI0033E11012